MIQNIQAGKPALSIRHRYANVSGKEKPMMKTA